MSKQLSKEQVALLIQERIQERLDERAFVKAMNEGLVTEGKVWDWIKNKIGSKDPEHSTKISGTVKQAMDQAADKTVKKMFEQFEKDYPGLPNIKSSEKFEKAVTELGLMYKSVSNSAINGQLPVVVANSIIVTLKQYTEALTQDLSKTYAALKEEEEELDEVSAKTAAGLGAIGGAAAATPGALAMAGSGIGTAATGYGGMLAAAGQSAVGLGGWILGGAPMTAGGLLGTLGTIGAPLAIGAGAILGIKALFGHSRRGMLKSLVKLMDPVDPAKAAPYSGERAAQATEIAQTMGQGNFKAAQQGYGAMQNTFAQGGIQQLQAQPQVIQQAGGALEAAIGEENAAAFVAVASGKTSLEDLPELQQEIIKVVLGQFQAGNPEENIEEAVELADAQMDIEEEKEKLEDEGEGEGERGGPTDIPPETPLSISDSNAEQEEPLIAVIQGLGLPPDAAASIAGKFVDYLNQRQIPVSEGNLKRLASRFANSLKEAAFSSVTDKRTSAQMKNRPPVPDEEDPSASTTTPPPPGDGDPSGPNQAAQQAMAQRAQGQATAQQPSAGDPEATTQQKSPEEIAKLKADLQAKQAQRTAASADPDAGTSKDAGAAYRAKVETGESALAKILVRAFEQAPDGDPLKSEEAVAIFSDPDQFFQVVSSITKALMSQLQSRGHDADKINDLLEHLMHRALLLEQDETHISRWKELARL